MFEDLLSLPGDDADDFQPLAGAPPTAILSAQVQTASEAPLPDWLAEPDAEIEKKLAKQAARDAFVAVQFDPNEDKQRIALASLKTPAAVLHLTSMLSNYDWAFIEQAKELRGYIVAQLLEETKNPTASIRLKALQQLGTVTEISLFTNRSEVTNVTLPASEVETRMRERLQRFLSGAAGHTPEVIDVTPTPAPTPNQTPNAATSGLDAELDAVQVHPTPPDAA